MNIASIYTIIFVFLYSRTAQKKPAIKRLPAQKVYFTFRLAFNYVSCLRSARTFNDIEFNFLTFGQGFEAIFLDSGEVNENVAAIFSFDEAITFFCAKPFYFTVHNKILLKKQFQLSCSSSVSVT